MIKTIIQHILYEQCISIFFSNIIHNFMYPRIKNVNDSYNFDMIKVIREHKDTIDVISYSDVKLIKAEFNGMRVHVGYSIISEYGNKTYGRYDFITFIEYENIVEIFQ